MEKSMHMRSYPRKTESVYWIPMSAKTGSGEDGLRVRCPPSESAHIENQLGERLSAFIGVRVIELPTKDCLIALRNEFP